MGNNAAFTQFEEIAIATYDEGSLTMTLLGSMMEAYRGVDIDSGGMRGILTNDGLDIHEVILKINGYVPPKRPSLPDGDWTDEQSEEFDNYHDTVYDMVREIKDKHGWG